MTEIKALSTKEVQNLINQQNTTIVDLRPSDAYNGWKLKGEKRGGHIKGAKSLPFKWFSYMDLIEVVRSKMILPENHLILYAYSTEETEKAAQFFIKSGYTNISFYHLFIQEWTTDEGLPMDYLQNFKNLVPAAWVNDLINGQNPIHYSNDQYVIVHSHYRNRDAYLSGHIPGAIDMDTLALEAPETWNRRSPKELKKALEQHGITSNTTVILYGKFMHPDNNDEFPGSAAGHIGAIRNAMIMMYAGVKDVRVLNGGFQSWKLSLIHI